MSVTITYQSKQYTVSTPTLTITPSNINAYLSGSFTPTVTRGAGGSETIYFAFIATDGTRSVTLSTYAAAIDARGVVRVTKWSDSYKLGRLASQLVSNNAKLNKIKVEIQTAGGASTGASATASYALSFSGFTPTTPTITYTTSQISPSDAQFGLVKGLASASWSASVAAKTWTYTDTSAQTINPPQTLSISANGATASSGSGTGTRSASLTSKLVSAVTLTGAATVTNVLGGSASNTKTLTVQDYIKPSLSALTVSRDSNNHAVITFNWSVAGVNEANTAANPCTSGTVTATWSATDNGTTPTTWSGAKTIIADGTVMSGTTGSCTITETAHTYDPDKSYTIAITITDRLVQSSATITTILASEFYTIDFLAGGQGVALGKAADKIGFEVNMDTFSPALAGAVQMFAGTTAPNGWLLCDGSAVSRTRYARLFTVIGTTYGAGDGSTTFNLPDLRGRFPLGSNTTYPLNDKRGEPTVTLTQDETPLPSHKHGTTITQPELNNDTHSHNTYYTSANRGSGSVSTRVGPVGSTGTAISTNSDTHTHTLKTNVAVTVNTPTGRTWNGSGVSSVQPHNNMPPFIGINFIIHAGTPTL